MQDSLFAPTHVVVRHAEDLSCPRCRCPVYRIPRRWVDRALHAFHPVRRYCCRSIVCSWEGTVRVPAAGRPTPSHSDTVYDRHRRLEASIGIPATPPVKEPISSRPPVGA